MVVGIILMAVSGAAFLYVAWTFRDSGVVSGVVGVFRIFCWTTGLGANGKVLR